MAVLTRIVAAATIVSIAFADIAGATAAENYAVAAQRARARSHHERAANVNSVGRENRKRGAQKRCNVPTTTSTLAAHTEAPTSSAPKKAVITTSKLTTAKATTTTTKAAAPAKSPSSPAPPATNPSSGGKNGKKLIGWSGTDEQLESIVKDYPGLAGVYNWGPQPPSVSGLSSWGMLWAGKSVSEFVKTASSFPVLMGENEYVFFFFACALNLISAHCDRPNLAAQADMSVEDVVAQWDQYIYPYAAKGKYLISPAVTSAPDGKDYMQTFFKTCKDPANHCGVRLLHCISTSI